MGLVDGMTWEREFEKHSTCSHKGELTMTINCKQVWDSAKTLCNLFGMDYENPNTPLPLLVINLLAHACAYNWRCDDVEILGEYFRSGCKFN